MENQWLFLCVFKIVLMVNHLKQQQTCMLLFQMIYQKKKIHFRHCSRAHQKRNMYKKWWLNLPSVLLMLTLAPILIKLSILIIFFLTLHYFFRLVLGRFWWLPEVNDFDDSTAARFPFSNKRSNKQSFSWLCLVCWPCLHHN